METLGILGAGGHSKVVADTARRRRWDRIVLYDDAWPERRVAGRWAVTGDTDRLLEDLGRLSGVVVAIGDNRTRLAKARELRGHGARLATLVDPAAVVSEDAALAAGTVVVAGAVVAVDASLGLACVVNTGASVDHDCTLADGVHVCPGAHVGGDVRIGESSWIGIGASILQSLRIGTGATVAAGAVVIADVPDGATVAGVPATPIRPTPRHAQGDPGISGRPARGDAGGRAA